MSDASLTMTALLLIGFDVGAPPPKPPPRGNSMKFELNNQRKIDRYAAEGDKAADSLDSS